MGLPNINIAFIGKGNSAITRSARGIVAVILKTTEEVGTSMNVYTSLSQVDFSKVSESNYNYLKLIFAGSPSKVMAVTIGSDGTYDTALKMLVNYKWNYLTVPSLTSDDVMQITSWIKEQRDQHHKTYKAVIANTKADHEGIINYTTENVMSNITNTTHTAAEYCARIAGLLAGLPLDRSSTYYVLEDVSNALIATDPDARIDAGELIIAFDGSKYKIGRGVNSLTTFTGSKTKDLSKIKIIEGKDMITDDISTTFVDMYVGKYINNYDNKQILVAAIRNYLQELEGNVLDPDYANTVQVDAEAQQKYLEKNGIDTSTYSETDMLVANTGSTVLLAAAIKFVDAMEDLEFNISM